MSAKQQRLIDGKPIGWYLYPPHPYPFDRPRQRIYSYCTPPTHSRPMRMLDEHGVVTSLDGSYADLKQYARRASRGWTGGQTIYVPHKARTLAWWQQMLAEASYDPEASVSYSPHGGFRGIRWERGGSHHSRGSSIRLDSAWGTSLLGIKPPDWLAGLRRGMEYLGMGDYDSSGALGEASLSRFWTTSGHRCQWRMGRDISHLLKHYSVGGRAEAPGARAHAFPQSYDVDLSHAYPTAVARGLPFGTPTYYSRETWVRHPRYDAPDALFGEWRITVHTTLDFSPVPQRDWSRAESGLVWTLFEGQVLTYAGWRDEIEALRATGAVSVEFLRGWAWTALDSFLAPWVDDLYGKRLFAEEQLDSFVARFTKQVNNSAIGMWQLDEPEWSVLSERDASISAGDLPLELCEERAQSVPLLGTLWLHKVSDTSRIARPVHWSSYVRMVVRIELWTRMMQELRGGNTLIASNFDSLLFVREPCFTQGSNDTSVCAAQAEHPWVWKPHAHGHTIVPYNRAVYFPDEHVQRTPGVPKMSQAMLLAQLVDHQRQRQAAGVPLWTS